MAQKSSPYIDFALEHGMGETYLAAIVALWRCETLLEDLDALERAAESIGRKDEPYFNFEIVSYYLVGFVTCLEWHARSRIVDSLTYYPETIEAKHFERINGELLAQMMRSNATIAHLIGAIQSISSLDDYNHAFARRVFAPLGIITEPRSLASAVTSKDRSDIGLVWEENLNEIIDAMYHLRHRLVHELGDDICGPHTRRESCSIEDARQFGRSTLLLMREVEKTIKSAAPKNYPNLLDDSYSPELPLVIWEDRVEELQREIEERLVESEDDYVMRTWRESQEADRKAAVMRHVFMEQVSFSSYMYFSPRVELHIMDYKQRIAYLEKLLEFAPEKNEDRKEDPDR